MENLNALTESEIEILIIENPSIIEKGLEIIDNQFRTEVGVLDILAKDIDGKYVVIELKRNRGSDKVIGQIMRYMGAIKEKYNLSTTSIRGIIFCEKASKKLLTASKMIDNISIIEFGDSNDKAANIKKKFHVTFTNEQINLIDTGVLLGKASNRVQYIRKAIDKLNEEIPRYMTMNELGDLADSDKDIMQKFRTFLKGHK